MKKLTLGLTLLTTFSTFAVDTLKGDYELETGDSSCAREVSVIDTQKETDKGNVRGLRLLPTRDIGTYFEDENAEDFLNINGESVKITTDNSSYGTKYVSNMQTKQVLTSLTKVGTLKQYDFWVRTSKIGVQVHLKLNGQKLDYKKILTGDANWTRECVYRKL